MWKKLRANGYGICAIAPEVKETGNKKKEWDDIGRRKKGV
jgi:hypothetical protein